MRSLFFGLSILVILISGCSIFSSAIAEPDLRELREEWQQQWEATETQVEIGELPSAVTTAIVSLPATKAASKAFLIRRNGDFCAYRIELTDQSVLHFSNDGSEVEKPQPLSTHGGIL